MTKVKGGIENVCELQLISRTNVAQAWTARSIKRDRTATDINYDRRAAEEMANTFRAIESLVALMKWVCCLSC